MNFCSILVIFVFVSFGCCEDQSEWWRHTAVYQIYPRSFQDSDNDGTGDLQGIISKLGYLKNIGIGAFWMSPIYKSPMADFGYDVANFTNVDPLFGNLSDFKVLVKEAHSKGLKVLMDLVPNHSSDKHEWFLRSEAKEDPYADYYIWKNAKGLDENGRPIPPNNWVSVFSGPMWTWSEKRQQFYLHQFLPQQPDLNYRNPKVVEEMQNVIRFWFELGVDGFRQDAVTHIWEDERFLDEPFNQQCGDKFNYACFQHIYTDNLPGSIDVLAKFDEVFKEYERKSGEAKLNMLEAYVSPQDQVKYNKVSSFSFNFNFIGLNTPVNANDVNWKITSLLNNLPDNQTANWVLGNHDQWRIGSRVGPDLINAFNMLSLTLPGVSVTYQGEEIGMVNNMLIPYDEAVDPAGCKCGPDLYLEAYCSRDPERTPFQWSDKPNAGFTVKGMKPWLPINKNYHLVNVETEDKDASSHLTIFKELTNLRLTQSILKTGKTSTKVIGDFLIVIRSNEEKVIAATVINFGRKNSVDISGMFHRSIKEAVVLISSDGMKGKHPPGSNIAINNIELNANQAVVIFMEEGFDFSDIQINVIG